MTSQRQIEADRRNARKGTGPTTADRLSRYEATLWRHVGQILIALDSLDRRKSQDRRSRYRVGSRQEPPAAESDQY
jgi:hypothetical protein